MSDFIAPTSDERFVNEHRQGDFIFGAFARQLVDMGWSVYPQTADSRRMPGMVGHDVIEWSVEHNLSQQLPSDEALQSWIEHCPTLNVAAVMGAGSGHAFAVDIDVLNVATVSVIEEIASRIFGASPLRRQGREPKVALFYVSDETDPVRNMARKFQSDDPDSEDGLEIQADSKSITFYGLHHKTHREFKWFGAQPIFIAPSDLPVVTGTQMDAFIEEVDSLFPFVRRDSQVHTSDWLDGNAAPRVGRISGSPEWTENRDGKVCDGREAFLVHLVFSETSRHARQIRSLAGDTVGVERLTDAISSTVVATFCDMAVTDNARWRSQNVPREARSRVSRLVRDILSGRKQIRSTQTSALRPASRKTASERPAPTEQLPPVSVSAQPAPPKAPVEPTLTGPAPSVAPSRGIRRRGSSMMQMDEASELVGDEPLLDTSIRHDATVEDVREEEDSAPEELLLKSPEASLSQELSFLKPASERNPIKDVGYKLGERDPSLEIPDDRTPIMSGINERLNASIAAFFDRVYDSIHDDDRGHVDIVIAPTGAGKTSQTMRFITQDPRTYRDLPGQEGMERRPIVMLLPTYANIEELRQRAALIDLDASLSDEALKAAALQTGLISEEDVDLRINEIRRDAMACDKDPSLPALRTMIYYGKVRAGCQMADMVSAAQAAGIGTSGFCKFTRRDDDGEPVTEYCQFYEGCQAVSQRQMIAQSHVVFMPHNFMSLEVPEELQAARAVIVDERVHSLFLHCKEMDLSTLYLDRKMPRLTAEEEGRGLTPEDLKIGREKAVDIVMEAFTNGVCPATAIINHPKRALRGTGEFVNDAYQYVHFAIRTCTSALRREARIVPNMSILDVQDICSQPMGFELREELKFWEIIYERIKWLNHDSVYEAAIAKCRTRLNRMLPKGTDERVDLERSMLEVELAEAMKYKRKACGSRDYRIQLRHQQEQDKPAREKIRISWRTVPNWTSTPTMLLDASAAPDIISKIWNLPVERVTVHDISEDVGKSLNVRIVAVVDSTFSGTKITGDASATMAQLTDNGRLLDRIRRGIAEVSGLYGDGRVVVGTSMKLRRLINDGWVRPENTDWCHFGAMRGLDVFKHHAAAVSISRMEIPVQSVDGLAAALSYDDQIPEEPLDIHGTGFLDLDGTEPAVPPKRPSRIRLRNGHTVSISIPQYAGRWARLIQAQYREEEILQFVGRLRPVYREGRTPVWFAISSVIPDSLIVDEVISLEDLVDNRRSDMWEAMAYTGGVVSAEILQAAMPAKFNSPLRARRAMNDAGLNEDLAQVEGRAGRAMSSFRWKPRRGEWRHVFVAGYVTAPHARIREVVRQTLGYVLIDIEDIAHVASQPASVRLPDTVDHGMGLLTREDILRKAYERLEKIGLYYMMGRKDSSLPSSGMSISGQAVTFRLPEAGEARKDIGTLMGYWSLREMRNAAPLIANYTEGQDDLDLL